MNVAIYGDTLEAYVAALSLSLLGNSVTLYKNAYPLNKNEQSFVFNEPMLKSRLDSALEKGFLSTEENNQFEPSDIHWCFFKNETQEPLISFISKLMQYDSSLHLILSTTLGVGSHSNLSNYYQDQIEAGKLKIATIPSFIRAGRAFDDFEQPELLLVGTEDSQLISRISELLAPIIEQAAKVMFVSGTEAELIKTSICGILATRLSLINELALLAEDLGIDINTVLEGIAADSRVGESYLEPGCGFGGLTLPQEVNNLLEQFSKTSSGSAMLKAAVETNNAQKEILFRKFWTHNKSDIVGLEVAVWGASFRPNSSSIDNSPIHELVEALSAQGCKIRIYDPAALTALANKYSGRDDLSLYDNMYEAIQDADALFIVTAWSEFINPDFYCLKKKMRRPVIYDGRNIYDPGELKEIGFEYYGVGRGQSYNQKREQ